MWQSELRSIKKEEGSSVVYVESVSLGIEKVGVSLKGS